MIDHVADGTARIRVGSGGVMLPKHTPLVVAEQFGTLERQYPGRIDETRLQYPARQSGSRDRIGRDVVQAVQAERCAARRQSLRRERVGLAEKPAP